jgi:regulator of Ty1 transposition protein 103
MSFSESSLIKKFQELNNTQQSVQTLSLWLIHHRKHSNTIVKSWLDQLASTTNCDRKLTFIYLANDILQNSRKKGNEYLKEFVTVLPSAIENTAKYADAKLRFTLERILNIWKDRKIYADETINDLKNTLHTTKSLEASSPSTETSANSTATTIKTTNDSSKSKISFNKINHSNNATKKSTTLSNDSSKKSEQTDRTLVNNSNNNKRKIDDNANSTSNESLPKITTQSKNSLREQIQKEMEISNIQAPEPLELINMLQELEKSASSDAVVREKIAELPTKVADANAIKNLKDKREGLELLTTVNDASTLLDNYNYRLQQELANRKQTALQLAAYIKQQRIQHENDQKVFNI